jgi:hypothetical protein
MFKNRVIEKPEAFFTNGFDEKGYIVDERYKIEVLAFSKSKLYASLLWLKRMETIKQADIDIFDSIRQHRNEVAHEPMKFLAVQNTISILQSLKT